MIKKEEWEMLHELGEAKREQGVSDKVVEAEKNSYAEKLKGELAAEIKEVLSEKKEIEASSAKKGWFKRLIEKIARTCQQETY